MTKTPLAQIFGMITGGAAVLGLLFGIFRFINSANSTTEAVKEQTRRIENLYQVVTSQDTVISRISHDVKDLKSDFNSMEEGLKSTQKSYSRYLLRDNTLTKEEFYQYMEGLDVKKN